MDIKALVARHGLSLLRLGDRDFYSDIFRADLYVAVGRAPTRKARMFRSVDMIPVREYDATLIAHRGELGDPQVAEAIIHELAHSVVGDSEINCYEWAIHTALADLTGEAKEALRVGLVHILKEIYADIDGFDSLEIPRFLEQNGVDVVALMPAVDDE